jgi:antagonist of KipI
MMHVDRPGLFSVLQDRGRYGSQRLGVPVNGAMDEWSHRLANILVGNPESCATLECTLAGPSVTFDRDTLIAMAGAPMTVTVDGIAIPHERAVLVKRDAKVIAGRCPAGARAYLAVRGGFATEPVLGSRSTFVRGGFGGFEGRALRKGDRLPVHEADLGYAGLSALLLRSGMPFVNGPAWRAYSPAAPGGGLRFLRGPQWDAFTDEAHERFTAQVYRADSRSDRMGYRLQGPALELRRPLELVSEPVNFGTVQVPPDGQPIVLMADRQGAGGYPKIAYVISADLPALAQTLPGESVGFREVALDEAEHAWLDFERRLAALRAMVLEQLQEVPEPFSSATSLRQTT